MNRVPTSTRVQALNMLVEGSSLRSTSRVTGVAMLTLRNLLRDAAAAARLFHDSVTRGVVTESVECDEVNSYVYAKPEHRLVVQGSPDHAGDVWSWSAIDVRSRMVLAWHVSLTREQKEADAFMYNLRKRVTGRLQINTDGLKSYPAAIDAAFGGDADHAVIIKLYEGGKVVKQTVKYVSGQPRRDRANTSYIERVNLTTRMAVRRLHRDTNAFSKKVQAHADALALFFVHYNFMRPHLSLRGQTPAMVAGVTDRPFAMADLVSLVDSLAPKPNRPKTYWKSKASKRILAGVA